MTEGVGGASSGRSRRPLLGDADQQGTRFSQPLSSTRCVIGWVVATALFLGCASIWYSATVPDDAYESIVPAVAITHGVLRCAYPAVSAVYPATNASSVPPLYPLIVAGTMAVTRIGSNDVPQFSPTARGCGRASVQALQRDYSARALLLLGLLGWPFLLGGFVLLLRASGRGRSRWEVLGACLIACTPAVFDTFIQYFHPEDMIAMGLILTALAAVIRSRWLVAGVCIGLACCAKQYSLLAAVPLLFAAPHRERWRFLLAVVGVAAVVLIPLWIAMGRGMMEATLGIHATPKGSPTFVGRLHLHGVALVAVSRALPLGLAGAAAAWARSRLKSALYRPQPLVALIAVSLALRLVFEVNLFSYYFMATAVALIALDVVGGRVRVETIGWIAVAMAFFPPAFDPLVLVVERDPVAIELPLVLCGLALAALPFYRSCMNDLRPPQSVRAGSFPGITVTSSELDGEAPKRHMGPNACVFESSASAVESRHR
jgi:hypothetical protein